jgi:acetyl-CoA carboxylase beta subunit
MANKTKYQFKRALNFDKKLLVCPQCYETLLQADIENFNVCPYCDYKFEPNNELEDFILQPVIDNWVSRFDIDPRRKTYLPFEADIF